MNEILCFGVYKFIFGFFFYVKKKVYDNFFNENMFNLFSWLKIIIIWNCIFFNSWRCLLMFYSGEKNILYCCFLLDERFYVGNNVKKD